MAEAAVAPPDKIQLEDDAPDSPRGKGTSLSREKRNEAREAMDKDFETDIRVLNKRKKEKRVHNKKNSTEDDLGLLYGDGITEKFQRFANKITLMVGKERNRVSLGMKNSYIIGEEGSTTPLRQSIDVTVGMNGSVATLEQSLSPSSSEDMENESDVDHIPLPADAESRALVPPLEFQLDDIESFGIQGDVSERVVDVTDGNEEKNDKKARDFLVLEPYKNIALILLKFGLMLLAFYLCFMMVAIALEFDFLLLLL